jgi:hypothetical protein
MIMAIFGLIIAAIHVPVVLLLRSGRETSRGLAEFMSLSIFVYFVPALLASAVIAIVV